MNRECDRNSFQSFESFGNIRTNLIYTLRRYHEWDLAQYGPHMLTEIALRIN